MGGECAAGGCQPVLADIATPLAAVFLAFLLGLVVLFWWGGRRVGRRSRYDFDDRGHARRISPDGNADDVQD